eukprot:7617500-Alexandrium_andersonii.AAC.1
MRDGRRGRFPRLLLTLAQSLVLGFLAWRAPISHGRRGRMALPGRVATCSLSIPSARSGQCQGGGVIANALSAGGSQWGSA